MFKPCSSHFTYYDHEDFNFTYKYLCIHVICCRELEQVRARMEADLARRQAELNRCRRQLGGQRQQNQPYVRRNRRDSVESDNDEHQTSDCRMQ